MRFRRGFRNPKRMRGFYKLYKRRKFGKTMSYLRRSVRRDNFNYTH